VIEEARFSVAVRHARVPRGGAKSADKRSGPRDPEGTRARILAAATREFSRHGLGGARVDRIATAARANKRMLYYYFGDKDELFRAVLEQAYASIRAAEQDLRLAAVSPVEGVRRMVAFTWEYYLAHPEFLTLLNSENLHRARHLKRSRVIQRVNLPLIETFDAVLRRGEREGVFRPGVDALQLYISIAGLCFFYLSNNHTLSTVFDRRIADPAMRPARLAHMTELVLASLTNLDGVRRPVEARALEVA
jgi:AcrR family transcriptional regulator